MNKYKALGLGLLFLVLAIIVWATGGDIVGWWLFLPAVCWFLPIGGYKFYRDWAIVAQANAERLAAAEQPPALPAPPDPEDYLSLGYCLNVAKAFLIREANRFAGLYMLGVQGVGKSAQLVNMILHDALAGRAVIVIDPHGDLVTDCIKRLPDYLLSKVHWLDMTDEHYPFGVNVFSGNDVSTGLKRAQVVDQVMHIFEAVWPDVLTKQIHLPRYLRNAVIVLLDNPGTTLVDMSHFLLNDAVRTRLLKNVTDPTVVEFWQTEYDELNYADRMKRVQPLLSRLELLFVGRSIVRNILGQAENGITFRHAIENGEIIFITLPIKSLTLDARLIGTMLVSLISRTVFSFGDVPAAERPGTSLYIDEFQHFVTPDIAELFTEGRKYGVKLTVAHQFRQQLSESLRHATKTAFTKICFRLTPDDAHEMAQLYPNKHAEVRPEDIDEHPLKYLLTYPINDYHVRLFVDRYLRVLQSKRRGNMVHITLPPSALTAMRSSRMQTYKVFDPTLHLDQLLYEVMTTGNPWLRIPWEIVEGFSGCGYTFYHEWRRVLDKDWWLGPDITYPPALVIERPDGSLHWTRRPEGSREELYNFIFCLRQTMHYVAEHPLGEATTLSTSEVAAELMELPNRTMYVRSGDEVAVVCTDDMEEPVSADEFAERLTAIRATTRKRDCTPKEDVERQLFGEPPSDQSDTPSPDDSNDTDDTDPPTPRWEEF